LITIICVNPIVENIFYVDSLNKGQKSKILNSIKSTGGKGVNVAKIVSRLNEKVCLIGFKAGYNGSIVDSDMVKNNILSLLIEVEGNTSENVKIIDKNDSIEFMGENPSVSLTNIGLFSDVFDEVIEKTDILICSGKLTKGLSDNFFNEYIKRAKENYIKTFVDLKGNVLREAVKAKPYFIKVNLDELRYLTDSIIDSFDDIIESAGVLVDQGIKNILITTANNTLLHVSKNNVYRVDNENKLKSNFNIDNDSLLAGYIKGVIKTKNEEEKLKIAAACAASEFSFEHDNVDDFNNINKFYENIKVSEYNIK
jgi:tagatose 6-phosphate kinase